MAIQSGRKAKASGRPPNSLAAKLFNNPQVTFALALILMDAILVALIITFVPYTKIDSDAYMSQGLYQLERRYGALGLSGFLYVYSAIQYLTGGEVFPAQVLFGVLYIANLCIVLFIYVKTVKLPWWALILLCLSKRAHSIFVLLLFNDCFAMTLLHAALASFLCQQWHLGMVLFSGAVSIKMNVLLYAQPLFLLLLKAMDVARVISALSTAALVQILVGLLFLISYPIPYISRAFNLGRVFIHFWSVNFKFVPEPIFVSKQFAVSLLVAHLGLLAAFAHYKWCKYEGGLFMTRHSGSKEMKDRNPGYFYSLPYMLWKTPYPTWLRLILFAGMELCWNIYLSNSYSSALLLCLHLVLLWGLWSAPSEHPYVEDESLKREKQK